MPNHLRSDEGAIALIVALSIVALLATVALVVDMGVIYNAKSSLQASADAAALAGAQELPNALSAHDVAVEYGELNSDEGVEVTVVTPYDGDPSKIEVRCTLEVDYQFGRSLGLDSINVSARAVGVKTGHWDGEALPFINLSHDYSTNPNIEMWNKVGSGDFGSIEDRDLINPGNVNTMFYLVGWADGVEVSKGKEADVKQEVGFIYDQHRDGSPVYLLSLKRSVISSGQVKLSDGTYRNLDKIKNGDVFAIDQLILLECEFVDYDKHDMRLDLMIRSTYDVAAGEFPPHYVSSTGTSASLTE